MRRVPTTETVSPERQDASPRQNNIKGAFSASARSAGYKASPFKIVSMPNALIIRSAFSASRTHEGPFHTADRKVLPTSVAISSIDSSARAAALSRFFSKIFFSCSVKNDTPARHRERKQFSFSTPIGRIQSDFFICFRERLFFFIFRRFNNGIVHIRRRLKISGAEIRVRKNGFRIGVSRVDS